MDILKFVFTPINFDERPYLRTDIFINGEDLLGKILQYEADVLHVSVGPTPYMGMRPDDLVRYLDQERLTSMIYACGDCGEAGCWPIDVDVQKNDQVVTWTNFRQPHRGINSKAGHWDYSRFPSFTFDKQQYQEAMEILRQAAKAE